MTCKCPTCGQPFEGVPVEMLAGLAPKTAGRIIRIVAARPGLDAMEIAAEIYADDPEGGPEQADRSVSVAISKANKIWSEHGWVVRGTQRVGGYYLRRVPQ